MNSDSNDIKEVNIRIRVSKERLKNNLTFVGATLVIFIFARNSTVRFGCILLCMLFIIGIFSIKDESANKEPIKKDKPKKEEKSSTKEIRKPVMPETVVHRSSMKKEAEPKPAPVEPEESKPVQTEQKTTVTDWSDFFDSLDNNSN